MFVEWLRREFDVDDSRLRAKNHLHEGLDLGAATTFRSTWLEIPVARFRAPYRAVADPTRRRSKHEFGCAPALYSCSLTARRLLGRIEAISSLFDIPG